MLRRFSRVGSPAQRTRVLRFLRYGTTSAIALGVSEATLLIVVGTGLTGATAGALIANVAGVPPSYLLSRYWIWRDADRRRTGRQFILYWVVSIISMLITSLATGFVAHHSTTHGSEHVELVGLAFLGLNLVLWIAKFVAYQKIVFRGGRRVPAIVEIADNVDIAPATIAAPVVDGVGTAAFYSSATRPTTAP